MAAPRARPGRLRRGADDRIDVHHAARAKPQHRLASARHHPWHPLLEHAPSRPPRPHRRGAAHLRRRRPPPPLRLAGKEVSLILTELQNKRNF